MEDIKKAEDLHMMVSDWLRVRYKHDVIMPCAIGSKRPLMPHGNGSEQKWGWSDFDCLLKKTVASSMSYISAKKLLGPGNFAGPRDVYMMYKEFMKNYDVGLLLHDLCVVDVDSREQAMELEERFPVLKEVPQEVTRKGKHYFFERSEMADREGYYDGPAQRIKGVDLKTKTANGGRGFLVISPSTDKRMTVYPESMRCGDEAGSGKKYGPLQTIPDALLKEIGVPRHDSKRVVMEFSERQGVVKMDWKEEMVTKINVKLCTIKKSSIQLMLEFVECPHMKVNITEKAEKKRVVLEDSRVTSQMSYIDLFQDQGQDKDIQVPLPRDICDEVCLTETLLLKMISILKTGGVNEMPYVNELLTVDEVKRMLILLDFLGASKQLLHPFNIPKGPIFQILDVASVDSEYALSIQKEKAERYWKRRNKLVRSESMPSLSVVQRLDNDIIGEKDIHRDRIDYRWLFPYQNAHYEYDNLRISTQPQIRHTYIKEMLIRYAGKVVLAGGAALGCVTEPAVEYNDYDLFLVCVTEDEATKLAREMASSVGVRVVAQTMNAITYIVNSSVEDPNEDDTEDITVQLIMKIYDSVGTILLSFDMDPCKVAIMASVGGHRLEVWSTETWVHAVSSRAFVLDTSIWSIGSVSRTLKYIVKGFDCFIPCTRRSARLNYMNQSASIKQGLTVPLQIGIIGRIRRLLMSGPSTPAGLRALFDVEDRLPATTRPTRTEVSQATRALASSGYTMMEKVRGNLMSLIRKAMNQGSQWLRWAGLKSVGLDESKLTWRSSDGLFDVFTKTNVDVEQVYDVRSLVMKVMTTLFNDGQLEWQDQYLINVYSMRLV